MRNTVKDFSAGSFDVKPLWLKDTNGDFVNLRFAASIEVTDVSGRSKIEHSEFPEGGAHLVVTTCDGSMAVLISGTADECRKYRDSLWVKLRGE